jgi:hypothetical protein
MQNRRGDRIALIGDDLVAGVIEIEAGQRDRRASGDGGSRRVGDRAFGRPKSAGGLPAVVGEIDDRARLDIAQEDERERVGGAAVVLNDSDVRKSERIRREGAAVFSGDSWSPVRDNGCAIANMGIEPPRRPTTMRTTRRMARLQLEQTNADSITPAAL